MSAKNQKAVLDAKRRKVISLREQGKTFREIGDSMDFTRSYAQILFKDACRRMNEANQELGLLSRRARNCLCHHKLETKKEIIEAIKSGRLHPMAVAKYGRVSHAEVCRWAGLVAYAHTPYEEVCAGINAANHELGLLPPRVRKRLALEGLKTRKQVIQAIESGSLHPLRLAKYGWLSHAEVCHWAGLE